MIKEKKIFKGVIVPMITPLNADLSVDTGSIEKIVDRFVDSGVAPFVLGTTGEAVSLSHNQKEAVVKTTVSVLGSGLPVYAGIAGNCLSESIENAKRYADLGASVVVAHLPFYYPLSESQMMRYFESLADGSPCPLIIYNMPITVKQSIPVASIDQLSHHPNILGVKDSERGADRLDQSLGLWTERRDFAYYLGWAAMSSYAVLNGADGLVPSTANLTPKLYKDLFAKAVGGDKPGAEQLQALTNWISEIYQKDRNLSQSLPALKAMMAIFGLCKPHMMPPLYELEAVEMAKIEEKIKKEFQNGLADVA